jgi:tetratricopeptide (TPR) repeat protein/tRNA A-37 threonylcarbamoyl transferase component Bud32
MNEREIFIGALQQESPAQQQAYLDKACGRDTPLRQRVEGLLRDYEKAAGFLSSPSPALVATANDLIQEGPGTVIGPYKLMELIGEGGMGLVFVAEQQEPIRRRVALKVLKPGMDTRQVIARFEAERQALALMDHPNIAQVHDGGTTPTGRPYFVMELVKGVPITEYCDQNQVPIRQRLELFLHVCQAVQHAHQKGIIHRDIKPSNVLVTPPVSPPCEGGDRGGVVKVIDFGVAKAVGQQLTDKTIYTQFAQLVGTPLYMSPEQAGQSGLDVDTRSDIYSLGVLLYELLTGTTPFDQERLKEVGFDELRRIIREEEPARPSTRISTLGKSSPHAPRAQPAGCVTRSVTTTIETIATNRKSDPRQLSRLFRGELDWIVMKALEKDRNRRYETASAFAADVQRYLKDEPVAACPPSGWYRFRKFARRNKTRLAVAAGLLLAVMVMAASIGWAAWREAESERAASARRASVVHDDLNAARTLVAGNKLAAARQALGEARAHLGNDRSSLEDLAAAVETGAAELDRFQLFLDLIDRAHEAETAPVVETTLARDGPQSDATTPRRVPAPASLGGMWRPEAAVPHLLRALALYDVMQRQEWNTTLSGSILSRDQVDQIRRLVYEELLWLADVITIRQVEHPSGRKLTPQAAARAALVYLGKAESAHPPTQALHALRARCHKTLGHELAFRAYMQLAEKTPPALARDHYGRGQAAYAAKQLTAGVQAFEAALRVEPTHYWSMMWLGYCWCDLGQRPEDYMTAVSVFTGCILKRPDHAHAFYCRGIAYEKLRRYQEAVADNSRAIELEPSHWMAWRARGDAYLDLGQAGKAIVDFSRAIELKPDEPAPWNGRGLAHHNLGQFAKALADYSKSIELDPKFAGTWCSRGFTHTELGQFAEAIADCRQAIRLEKNFPEAHYNLGRALKAKGDLDGAIVAYREAIRLKPDYAFAHNNLGTALVGKGRLDEAVVEYKEASRLKPDLAEPHMGLGTVLCDYNKDYDGAIAEFRQAIRLKKDYPDAHYNLGLALNAKGDLDGAIAEYREALGTKQEDRNAYKSHYNLGNGLRAKGDLDGAIAAYRQATLLKKDYAEAHCNLGNALRDRGLLDEAVAEYREAIRVKKDLREAHMGLGALLCNYKKDYDGAIAEFREAVRIKPDDHHTRVNLGFALQQKARRDEAIAEFREAIRLKRDYTRAYIALAELLATTADPKVRDGAEALNLARKAVELAPGDTGAWQTLGWALCSTGACKESTLAFHKSMGLQQDPKGGDSGQWFGLAAAHWKLGQREQARTWYGKAVEWMDKNAPQSEEFRRFRAEAAQVLGITGKKS